MGSVPTAARAGPTVLMSVRPAAPASTAAGTRKTAAPVVGASASCNQIAEAPHNLKGDFLKLVEMPLAAFDLELFKWAQK
jgi:hypothetical protein